MNHPVTLTILVIFVVAVIVALFDTFFGTAYQKSKIKRQFKCLTGTHALDSIKSESGRTIQRCLYCDRIIHEFQLTEMHGPGDQVNQSIRRIK